MKQIAFIILTLSFATTVFGQKYLTVDIRAKADSILRTYIGDTLFYNHCVYDTNTYYEYKNFFGKSKSETLINFERTKGKFVKVDMRWVISILYPQCPAFDKISGMTSFVLDSTLNPQGRPYLDFIPDFFWTKDSCYLIGREKALTIAIQQDLKHGIDTLTAFIKYDRITKTFSWEVSQTLWLKKDTFNNDYGESEIITIDAKSGEIKSHQTVFFSAIY